MKCIKKLKKNNGSYEIYRAIEELSYFVNWSYIKGELNDALATVHNINKVEGQKWYF